MAPALFALGGAALHKYPFTDRFLLFLAPAVLLLVGVGADHMGVLGKNVRGLGPLVALLVVGPVVLWNARYLLDPIRFEELRPVLEQFVELRQPEDACYLYYGAIPTARYYFPRLGIREASCTLGKAHREDWLRYCDDLQPFLGRGRVWVVFSHVCNWRGVDEIELIDRFLLRHGRAVMKIKRQNAGAYLYDLTAPPEISPGRPNGTAVTERRADLD